MQSKKRTFLCLCIFAALVVAAPTVMAAESPGTAAVRKANETIKGLLKKEAQPGSAQEKKLASQVTKSVRGFLDVSELGRRSMRDHWSKLSKKQHKAFLTVLTELIEKNYVLGLRSNLDYAVEYSSEKKDGDNILVETAIQDKASTSSRAISVDYVLHKHKGKLRAFDVITDGVGLVENYRAMFNKLIAKEGFEGLLSRMKRKRDSLAAPPP